MWPLSRRRSEVMRIACNHVERWHETPRGLVRLAREGLQASTAPRTDALKAALSAVFESEGDAASTDVDVVIESAWLPALPLEVGQTLWSPAQLETLLRHRLAQLYGDAEEPIDAWSVRLDYRAGESWGIGYALAPGVADVLIAAIAAAGGRCASLQPAFAWGWQRFGKRPPLPANENRWWVWMEADRALVARVERSRLRALNPAAPAIAHDAQLRRLIGVEAIRWGIESARHAIVAATWDALPDGQRLAGQDPAATWLCVAAPASERVTNTLQREEQAA